MSSHVNAVCMGWGGDLCLSINHTSCLLVLSSQELERGPSSRGSIRVHRHARGWWSFTSHLSWMAPSPFEYLSLFFFQPRPPNPVTACPFPGQPLARLLPPPPHVKLEKKSTTTPKSPQDNQFLFLVRKRSVCACARTCGGGGWCNRESGGGGGVCVRIHV